MWEIKYYFYTMSLIHYLILPIDVCLQCVRYKILNMCLRYSQLRLRLTVQQSGDEWN